jgi:hypothetical protein
MSTMNGNHKSPDEIEREVEEARANVRSTLGDIRHGLSPGQMIDQAMDYVRGSGGGEFGRNLGRSVRDNPIPVALIGAGIGWLLLSDRSSGQRRSRETSGRHTGEYYVERERREAFDDDRSEGMLASARDTASSMTDSARRMIHNVKDKVTEGASAAGDYASSSGERIRHAGGRVRAVSGEAQRTVSRMIEEQPLIIGAVGFVAGALIGAAAPLSRTEERLFGETADDVRDRARQMAREGLSEAGAMAGEIVREARDTLDERGLTPQGLKESAAAVSDRIKETIDPGRKEDGEASTRPVGGKPGAAPGIPPETSPGLSASPVGPTGAASGAQGAVPPGGKARTGL